MKLFLVFSLSLNLLWADAGKLLVVVQDAQKRPVKGVQIGIEGLGDVKLTGDDGKALLNLTKDTSENDWVSLQILHSPPGKDLVMVSPFDTRALVPSFKSKAENFVRIIVVQRGDLAALQDGTILRQLTENLNKRDGNKPPNASSTAESSKANLASVAKQVGLTADDLEKAIRAWGARTNDPYDAGLAALHERNYDKATTDLQESLKQREEKLSSDQNSVAFAAFFLGQSFFDQKKYLESISPYQRCLSIWQSSNNGQAQALTLLRLAQANEILNEPDRFKLAVAYFKQAIPLFRSSGDKFNEAMCLWGLGTSSDRISQTETARDAYNSAIPLLSQVSGLAGKRSIRGRILLSLGEDEDRLGNPVRAVECYQEALPLLDSPDDAVSKGLLLMQLAAAQKKAGDDNQAISTYREAVVVWHLSQQFSSEATADLALGMEFAYLSNPTAASQAYQAAADAFDQARDPASKGSALFGLAKVYASQGDYKQALESSLKSLSLLGGNPKASAVVLQLAGKSSAKLHDQKSALDYLNQSMALSKDSAKTTAFTLGLIADTYTDIGDETNATATLKQALDLCEKTAGCDDSQMQSIKQKLRLLSENH